MKYYELSLITGKSATELRETWSDLDVNWAMMVRRAQEESRIAIAIKNKIPPSDVPIPTSCDLRKDDGD